MFKMKKILYIVIGILLIGIVIAGVTSNFIISKEREIALQNAGYLNFIAIEYTNGEVCLYGNMINNRTRIIGCTKDLENIETWKTDKINRVADVEIERQATSKTETNREDITFSSK